MQPCKCNRAQFNVTTAAELFILYFLIKIYKNTLIEILVCLCSSLSSSKLIYQVIHHSIFSLIVKGKTRNGLFHLPPI